MTDPTNLNNDNIDGHIWNDILKEAMTKKDVEDSNIFVFGDRSVGKKTLFRLINQEINSKGEETKKTLVIDEISAKFGLIEYTYLNIKKLNEEDAEVLGKIGVWIVNDLIDEETFIKLIKPELILKSMCLIVLDLTRPNEMKKSLTKWLTYVYNVINKLLIKLPFDKQTEIRNKGKIKILIKLLLLFIYYYL
jgi:hypothetical protein